MVTSENSSTHHRCPLNAETLRANLREDTRIQWGQIEVMQTVDSTNTVVGQWAEHSYPDFSLLCADEQTAGKGRKGRAWESYPRTQALMSLLIRVPDTLTNIFGLLPLAAGEALARMLNEKYGVSASVKWPNDVLVDDKKIAGILVEAHKRAGAWGIVIGWGINISQLPAELPGDFATSVDIAAGQHVDRQQLCADAALAVGEAVHEWKTLTRPSHWDAFRARYTQRSTTLGTHVKAHLPGGDELEGIAVDIGPVGQLIIEKNGNTHQVHAGDVVHLRPSTS